MLLQTFTILLLTTAVSIQAVYSNNHLNIGFILNQCEENSSTTIQTYKNAAIWTVQRLNYLESTPFTLQVKMYSSCRDLDVYNDVFDVLKRDNSSFTLGVVSLSDLPAKSQRVCEAFEVRCVTKSVYFNEMVRAVVSFLETFSTDRFLSVVAYDDGVLDEFNTLARLKGICVGRSVNSRTKLFHLKHIHGRNVIFGTRQEIYAFLNGHYKEAKLENAEFIFVSLDGLPIKDLPENSYVITPVFLEDSPKYEIGSKLTPSTLLFEIANPILQMVTNISGLVSLNCDESFSKLDCFYNLQENFIKHQQKNLSPFEILSQLKIESVMNQFTYNIFKIETININQTNHIIQNWVLIGNYSVFEQTTLINEPITQEKTNETNKINCTSLTIEQCFSNCVNFDFTNINNYERIGIWLRSDSWVYAYLSISSLGCIISLAIIIFFFVRICKGDIFEGNPTLTILSLLLVICMYCSVIPFSIQADSSYKDVLCLSKTLSTSIVFACTFSLLLSRCILLATISKEVGFMAHVSGPVQTCLFLFMMAVQIALNLQYVENCSLTMTKHCFLCLLSYNMILLFLLICTICFIFGSERNYREGKYFGIAIFMITCVWSVWVPLYWFYKGYEDAILCFGLVGTASSLLGAVFIPRTYVMTISVARDKFTSALPALASAASAIDIYRASTQPIYDCINVAAINATNNTGTNVHQSDLYNCPSLTEEFASQKLDTPVNSDKLTRF